MPALSLTQENKGPSYKFEFEHLHLDSTQTWYIIYTYSIVLARKSLEGHKIDTYPLTFVSNHDFLLD